MQYYTILSANFQAKSQEEKAEITSSFLFTMPFDCAQDRPFDNGDFVGCQAVKGVNHLVFRVLI
jgi:hypothetical protein